MARLLRIVSLVKDSQLDRRLNSAPSGDPHETAGTQPLLGVKNIPLQVGDGSLKKVLSCLKTLLREALGDLEWLRVSSVAGSYNCEGVTDEDGISFASRVALVCSRSDQYFANVDNGHDQAFRAVKKAFEDTGLAGPAGESSEERWAAVADTSAKEQLRIPVKIDEAWDTSERSREYLNAGEHDLDARYFAHAQLDE